MNTGANNPRWQPLMLSGRKRRRSYLGIFLCLRSGKPPPIRKTGRFLVLTRSIFSFDTSPIPG